MRELYDAHTGKSSNSNGYGDEINLDPAGCGDIMHHYVSIEYMLKISKIT